MTPGARFRVLCHQWISNQGSTELKILVEFGEVVVDQFFSVDSSRKLRSRIECR
jgi:hypothetical protein